MSGDILSVGRRKYRYRRHGLYAKNGKTPRVLIEAAGHCTMPVEVQHETKIDFGKEAAYRGTSPEVLFGRVLDVIARDDLFAAVLDTSEG